MFGGRGSVVEGEKGFTRVIHRAVGFDIDCFDFGWCVFKVFSCMCSNQVADNPDLRYRLAREAKELCRLSFIWRKDCRGVPGDIGECWGPSEIQMLDAGALEYNIQVDIECGLEDELSAEEEEPYDEELYDQLETMALRDEYRGNASNRHVLPEETFSSDSERGMAISPTKKRRRIVR